MTVRRRCGTARFRWGHAALALALAACVGAGRALAPYPGAEDQIRAYYAANAFELNATCVTPYISNIVAVDVVRDDDRQLVLDVRYLYDVQARPAAWGIAACNNFASRRFTFDKTETGLRLTGMTGEQRGRAG